MPKSSPPKANRRWSPLSRSNSKSSSPSKVEPEYAEQPSHHPSTLPKPVPYSATTPTSYNPLSAWTYIPPNSNSTFSYPSTFLPNPSSYTLTTRLPRLLTPSSQYSQQSIQLPPLHLPPPAYRLRPHLNRRFNLAIYHKKTNKLSAEYKEFTTILLNSERSILLSTPNLLPSYLNLVEDRVDEATKALSRAHDIIFSSINAFPYSFFASYNEGERDREVEEVLKDLWDVKNCVMKEIRSYIKLKGKRTTREEIWCGGLVAGGGLEVLGMAEEAGRDMERILRNLEGGQVKLERTVKTNQRRWDEGEYQNGFMGEEFDPASYGYDQSYDPLPSLQYSHLPFQMGPDNSRLNTVGTGSILDLRVDFGDFSLPPDPFTPSDITAPYDPITKLETAVPDYSNQYGNETSMMAHTEFTTGELEGIDNILSDLDFDWGSHNLVNPAISTTLVDSTTNDGPIGLKQPELNEMELEFNFDDYLLPDSSDSEPETPVRFRSDAAACTEAAPNPVDSSPRSSSSFPSDSTFPINTCFDEIENYGTFTTESVEIQQVGGQEREVDQDELGFDPLFYEIEDFWELSGGDGLQL